MINIIARILTLLFLVACSNPVFAEEFVLKDGRRIVLTNKSCSDCPDPTIKLLSNDGKVITDLPAKEKTLIFSSIVLDEGRYLVTATTGGEGAIRVYDIAKKAMIFKAQPFGTAKTWGELIALGNREFAILSSPGHSYIKEDAESSRLTFYAISGGKVKETARLKTAAKGRAFLASAKPNQFTLVGDDSVYEIDRLGKVIKSVSFDKGMLITDQKYDESGQLVLLARLYDKYFAFSVGSSVKAALLQEVPPEYLQGKKHIDSSSKAIKFIDSGKSKIGTQRGNQEKTYLADLNAVDFKEIPVVVSSTNTACKVGEYNNENGLVYKGVYVWDSGDKYEGEFAKDMKDVYRRGFAGKRTGKGVYAWANGDVYKGDFIDGARTGKGLYTWSNGNKYDGDFIAGKMTGKGVFSWAKGDKYEGDFVEDARTGKGTYTWANGNKKSGDFVNGVLK